MAGWHDISGMTLFDEWVESSVVRGEPPLSLSSTAVYKAMWGKFCNYLYDHQRTILNADEAAVAHFVENIKPGIRQRYLQLMARVYSWLTAEHRVKHNPVLNPMKAYRPTSLKRKTPAAMPKHMLSRFIAALPPAHGRFNIRDRAMMMLILASGIKVSEMVKLRIADVVLDQSPTYLYIAPNGTSNERLAPLAKIAHEPLQQWIALLDADEDDLLFPGEGGVNGMSPSAVYRRVAAIARDANIDIKHVGPMMLRHTFAVKQVVEDRPINVLQQWLGHHQRRSTEVYQNLVVNPGGWEPA